MKRFLLSTVAALGLASAAHATNISYDSYSTPDSVAFNLATTTATGATDTPYSYYTGPVVFSLTGGGSLTAYCVDLNHFLASSGMYTTGLFDHNGEGQAISEFDSNRIGHIALLGAAALGLGTNAGNLIAAAAQAAIWDIAYAVDGATTTSSNSLFNTDLSDFLGDHFTGGGYATALLVPAGDDNQLMVTGLAAGAPEPSTWAMGIIGFAVLGFMGYRKSRAASALA
jgi:hypothetical protein